MKLNPEYSVCEVSGKSFLVPTGSKTMDVNKMMDLNGSALFIIDELKKAELTYEQLLSKMLEEYDVKKDIVAADLSEFIEKAKMAGIIIS